MIFVLVGMTEPTLDHVGIMMRDMHINLQEIEEYINWVEPMPCIIAVPKIPVAKESQLNFLKPGSREVVTRPVHVHEHLPPMFPELEVLEEEQRAATPTEASSSNEPIKVVTSPEQSEGENVFKRPGDPISDSQPSKRPKLSFGEEGRPTREISSVMMTSSGFLSPAREGKLPESRTPISVLEPQVYPTQPTEIIPRVDKKIKKGNGDGKRKEFRTELFKPDKILMGENGMKIKKITAKESKLKPFKKSGMSSLDGKGQSLAKQIPSDTKIQKITIDSVESIEETRVQISPQSAEIGVTIIEIDHKGVRKLSTELDKVKLNIFKKISSKNKEEIREKTEKEHRKSDHFNLIVASQNSREHAVDIIPINDKFQMKPEKCKTPEITIKEESLFPSIMQNREVILTPAKVVDRHIPTYDLASSPSRAPKTPEIHQAQTPLTSKKVKVDKEKKKRKDKLKKIKGSKERAPKERVKHLNKRIKLEKILNINSKRMLMLEKQRIKTPPAADLIKSEPIECFEDDIELNDRPKTPNDPITIKTEQQPPILPTFPFITQFPSGPGLIPKTVYPPFFPRGIGKHGFGQPPILPNNSLSLVTSPSPSPAKSEFPSSPPPTPIPTTIHAPSPIKIEAELHSTATPSPIKIEKKNKEHKKDKKDKLEKKKLKKKDKKDKKKLKEKAVKKLEKLKMKTKKEKKHKEVSVEIVELHSFLIIIGNSQNNFGLLCQ